MNNKNNMIIFIITLIMGVMLGFSLAIATVNVEQLTNQDIKLSWFGQNFIHRTELNK